MDDEIRIIDTKWNYILVEKMENVFIMVNL